MAESVAVRTFRLLEKTSGRDRLCRVIQYGSKFISWLLQQEGVSDEVVVRVRTLESSISTARKLFRLGKSFDHLRVAFQTIHLKDPIQRFLITFAKINRFLFLLFDHLVWAGRVKLLKVDTKRWTKNSARFWLLAVVCCLLRDMYDFFCALRIEQVRLKHDSTGAEKTLKNAVTRTICNNSALVLDFVKNGADIFLPISQLDIGSGLSSGLIGILGVVSSICSLATIWNEALKLRYS